MVARTAYHLLFSAFNLRAGHRVLVHPVSGGVGLMVTQMAVEAGAKVIGTTYSPHKMAQALNLGAELVIDRSQRDFVQEVMAHTNGEGVDLVVDSLGGETLWQSFDALALYGRVVNIGETQGWPEGAVRDLRDKLYERSTSFAGFELDVCEGTAHWTRGTQYCLERLASGKLAAPIAQVFPFEQCREMFAALESKALRQVPITNQELIAKAGVRFTSKADDLLTPRPSYGVPMSPIDVWKLPLQADA